MNIKDAADKLKRYWVDGRRVEDMDDAVDALLKLVDSVIGEAAANTES
jgi:hypothetical protein